jgi:hypothetical protein
MIVDSPRTIARTAAERGVMTIGFHCVCVQDDSGDSWLTGVGFVWGELFIGIASDVMAGTWEPRNKVGTLAEGSAVIAPYGPAIDTETAAVVAEKRAALAAGNLEVFAGPIVDSEGRMVVPQGEVADVATLLASTDYFVQGVTWKTH